MKFGLELEQFLLKDGQVAVCPSSIPHDDCGWLVEYRSHPRSDPFEAVGSLMADFERVQRQVRSLGFTTSDQPYMTVPREVKLAARRTYTEDVLRYQNLYGKKPSTLDHAGVHVSFTNPQEVRDSANGRSTIINGIWDFPTVFKKLDARYAREIKASRRVPGFYELKTDGRIEYRSLPITISLWDLAEFLKSLSYR